MGENGTIEKMEEKPELSFFTNTGMYVVESRVIDEMQDNIAIGFPEIIENYKSKNEKIGVYPISGDSWLDMGQLKEMEEMIKRVDI